MGNNWFDKRPVIALAPMADYTDQPFSLLCREISGKNFVIFREMVSAEAIVRGNAKTLKMCQVDERERPVVLQIFGDKPEIMAKAAAIIVDRFHPDGIDINMGCPVPKIAQKSKAGAALMKYPDLAVKIIQAIKAEKIVCPLSVKTRLGWSEDRTVVDFGLRLEKAGIDAITVHGRTKDQGYSGTANWAEIGEVKRALKIPVIANGDIKTAEDIERCLNITSADGVMIGRGALGNPWVFRRAAGSRNLTLKEIRAVILRHAEFHLEHYGERGMITLRKHLPWYFHGARAAEIKEIKKIRAKLVRVSSVGELNAILSSF